MSNSSITNLPFTKTALVSADLLVIDDSENSQETTNVTFANLVASIGAEGQTPWLSTINADGNDLEDLNALEFRNPGSEPPAATVPYVTMESTNLTLNTPSTKGIEFQIAAATFMVLNATNLSLTNTPLDMGTQKITGLAEPTDTTDAATKEYVDAIAAGLEWKTPATVASTANIDLTTGTLLTIDTVTLTAGQRVLVKDQSDATENGVYAAAVGQWDRTTDADDPTELEHLTIFVEEGSANINKAFTCTSTDITIGVTDIDFVEIFSSQLVAGDGLVLDGNVIDVGAGDGIVVNTNDVAVASTVVQTNQTNTFEDFLQTFGGDVIVGADDDRKSLTVNGTVQATTSFVHKDNSLQQYAAPPNKIFGNIKSAAFDHVGAVTTNNPHDIFLNKDRDIAYIVNKIGVLNSTVIEQYNLTTPGEIPVSFGTPDFTFSPPVQFNATGIYVDFDEQTFWLVDQITDTVVKYEMDTPRELSPATSISTSTVNLIESNPLALELNYDKSLLWVVGSNNNTIYEFEFGTAGDPSTLLASVNNKNVSSLDTSCQGLSVSTDGSILYLAGDSTQSIFQIEFKTINNISSLDIDNVVDIDTLDNDPTGVFVDAISDKLYISGNENNEILQFNLGLIISGSYQGAGGNIGFFGTLPIAIQNVDPVGNTAAQLADVVAALTGYGLITNV